MPEIADAWVSIYPKFGNGFASSVVNDTKKATKAAADETSKSNAFGKSGTEQGKKFGNGFKAAAGTLIAAVSIGAIKNLVTMAVDSFSELEDATAAAGVVFGDNMDEIIAQSKNAATQMGMSQKQVIDAANTFGTYGKGAGLAGSALADFSKQMTQTAGDMASFKGGSPEEAIQAVGAALRGETEPIRRYGVLLDDASLRAQALKMGLIATTKQALTPQQKVLAAQAEILRQTTDAQGDFARTSDSTANVAKTLAAESANLSAELGEKLAPAITTAKKAGIELLTWITDNQAALVPMVATFGTLALAVGGFVGAAKGIEALKSAKATIDGLKVSFDAMSTSAKAASIATGAIGIAVAAASIGYGIWAQTTQEAKQRVEDLTQAIKADSGALGENARAYAANAMQKSGALDAAQKLGVGVDVAVSAALGEKAAIEEINAAYAARTKAIEEAATAASGEADTLQDSRVGYLDSRAALTKLGDSYNLLSGDVAGLQADTQEALANQKQFEEAVGTTGTKAGNTSLAIDGLTDATDGANSSASDGKSAFDKYAESINKAYDASLKLRSDRRGLKAAFDDAAESVKKNGKTLDENTEKGRANQEALDGIVQKGRDWAQDLKDQKKPQSEINAAMKKSRDSFIKAATAMGMSGSAAAQMATDLGLVKDPATEAADRLKDLKKKAKELDGQNIKISVSASMNRKADEIVYKVGSSGTMKFTARRLGGPVLKGQPYIVGEDEPEILVPKQDGYIVNQQQAAQAAAGVRRGSLAGAQITVVNHFPQAEPTSATVNRSLQYAAALGVL